MRCVTRSLFAVAFAALLIPALQAQEQSKDDLKVAPDAPKSTPEPANSPGPQSKANICAELTAFLEEAATKKKDGQQGKAATAPPRGKEDGREAGTAPEVDKAQHNSGVTEPIPNASNEQSSPELAEQAKQVATGGDVRQCQTAVRTLRKSGMPMPAALIALGALKPELL